METNLNFASHLKAILLDLYFSLLECFASLQDQYLLCFPVIFEVLVWGFSVVSLEQFVSRTFILSKCI